MFKPGMPRKPPQNGSAFSAAPWRMVFLDVSGSVSHTANVGDVGRCVGSGHFDALWSGKGPPGAPGAPMHQRSVYESDVMDPWTPWTTSYHGGGPHCRLGLSTGHQRGPAGVCSNFLVKSGRFLV